MAERSSVLVVEDDEVIAEVLVDYLRQAGHQVQRLARGDEVLPLLAAEAVDVLLLDLMLPGLDGLAICRALDTAPLASKLRPAVLMVTARVEEIDRLLGLEMGADDYICKPFSPREVVARVKAVLRRRSATAANSGAAPGLLLDPVGSRASLDGRELGLTAVEFLLLQSLARQPGRIHSRDQLMDAMYPDARVVVDRTVDSHVKKLRRKLAEVRPGEEFIVSVYGMGYKFEPAGQE